MSKFTSADHNKIQRIRDKATKKYTKQFDGLLSSVDYLLSPNNEYYTHIIEQINQEMPKMISKLESLFGRCKKVCEQKIPANAKIQLSKVAVKNKYAFVNTCKTVSVIEECIKFLALYNLFETRLRMLNDRLRWAESNVLLDWKHSYLKKTPNSQSKSRSFYPSRTRNVTPAPTKRSLKKTRKLSHLENEIYESREQLNVFYAQFSRFAGFISS